MAASGTPAAKGKPGIDLKRVPAWGWMLAIAAGLLIGLFLLKRKPADATAQTSNGTAQPILGAQTGEPSQNSAPADQLTPAVLGALGFSLEQIGSMGNALANVAIGAQNQLGYISTTALSQSAAIAQASFGLAAAAVASGAASRAPASNTTTIIYGGGGGGGAPSQAPAAAPAEVAPAATTSPVADYSGPTSDPWTNQQIANPANNWEDPQVSLVTVGSPNAPIQGGQGGRFE